MMPLTSDKKREYQREWVRARRDAYFRDKVCVRCGSTSNLELDHIDASTKELRVSALWSMSDKNPKKLAEIEKCQVLCAPCHDLKTYESKEYVRGDLAPSTRYSDELVLELRRRYDAGERQVDLARELGVSRGGIWYLLHTRAVLTDNGLV